MYVYNVFTKKNINAKQINRTGVAVSQADDSEKDLLFSFRRQIPSVGDDLRQLSQVAQLLVRASFNQTAEDGHDGRAAGFLVVLTRLRDVTRIVLGDFI